MRVYTLNCANSIIAARRVRAATIRSMSNLTMELGTCQRQESADKPPGENEKSRFNGDCTKRGVGLKIWPPASARAPLTGATATPARVLTAAAKAKTCASQQFAPRWLNPSEVDPTINKEVEQLAREAVAFTRACRTKGLRRTRWPTRSGGRRRG